MARYHVYAEKLDKRAGKTGGAGMHMAAEARTWAAGVRVVIDTRPGPKGEKDALDAFAVYLTGGTNDPADTKWMLTVTYNTLTGETSYSDGISGITDSKAETDLRHLDQLVMTALAANEYLNPEWLARYDDFVANLYEHLGIQRPEKSLDPRDQIRDYLRSAILDMENAHRIVLGTSMFSKSCMSPTGMCALCAARERLDQLLVIVSNLQAPKQA